MLGILSVEAPPETGSAQSDHLLLHLRATHRQPVRVSAPVLSPPPTAPPHRPADDVAGVLIGTFLASFGIFLLEGAGAVTGGTAGLALLLVHATPLPFAVLYGLVTVPFLVLATARLGAAFAVRTAVSVALVSVLSLLHPKAVSLADLSPVYGTVVGNLAVGIGLLVLFRHRTSLGGYNVVALLAQERRGWRAGWVQLLLDGLTVALGVLVAPLPIVLLSVAGAVVLNLVLAMNHRPGRYSG
jgi:uncharacterized membrane-anchored protein YitT (DUF2179 family)